MWEKSSQSGGGGSGETEWMNEWVDARGELSMNWMMELRSREWEKALLSIFLEETTQSKSQVQLLVMRLRNGGMKGRRVKKKKERKRLSRIRRFFSDHFLQYSFFYFRNKKVLLAAGLPPVKTINTTYTQDTMYLLRWRSLMHCFLELVKDFFLLWDLF